MKRLSSATFGSLPQSVRRPQYDRGATKIGIVHLGIGAFHRAHQAIYTEDVLNLQAGNWAVLGASLRRPDVRDQLHAQDNLYTVLQRDEDGEDIRLIGAVKEIVVAPQNPRRLTQAIASPAVKIVSLTVTEKGYYLGPATGHLQLEHPDIRHDLKNPDQPKTIFGYLLAALKLRRVKGLPLTLMSCDNLPKNSQVLQQALLAFAAISCPETKAWIKEHCRFPCTMVDRMVPATTDEDRRDVAKKINLQDQALVVCEPFRQWVIEDNFACGRPAWEKAGALIVKDVNPYEEIKLRLLNGAHSAIAYLGFLAGFDYIYQASQNKTMVRYVKKLMDAEITPGLNVPEDIDIEDYKNSILKRFSNPNVKYTTVQVATDGSQKLPQRWLDSLYHQIGDGGQYDLLCLALAGWIRYLRGVDEKGVHYDYSDPLRAVLLKSVTVPNITLRQQVINILSVDAVFVPGLQENIPLVDKIAGWLEILDREGALKTIEIALRP
ncbi:MAG: mannitol dehydrogenase family protein [Robiginitomaculum sp.]|nr:mannitol dehydrogenase family protein [Robiginitomaculum sp.]